MIRQNMPSGSTTGRKRFGAKIMRSSLIESAIGRKNGLRVADRAQGKGI